MLFNPAEGSAARLVKNITVYLISVKLKMNAMFEKTSKGEIMRGFAGEAPDLESLVCPAVSAGLETGGRRPAGPGDGEGAVQRF